MSEAFFMKGALLPQWRTLKKRATDVNTTWSMEKNESEVSHPIRNIHYSGGFSL